jgi:hypothetical protein
MELDLTRRRLQIRPYVCIRNSEMDVDAVPLGLQASREYGAKNVVERAVYAAHRQLVLYSQDLHKIIGLDNPIGMPLDCTDERHPVFLIPPPYGLPL